MNRFRPGFVRQAQPISPSRSVTSSCCRFNRSGRTDRPCGPIRKRRSRAERRSSLLDAGACVSVPPHRRPAPSGRGADPRHPVPPPAQPPHPSRPRARVGEGKERGSGGIANAGARDAGGANGARSSHPSGRTPDDKSSASRTRARLRPREAPPRRAGSGAGRRTLAGDWRCRRHETGTPRVGTR